ncbi:hypothetical protein BC827DRAFT_887993 [Russula dissimulans]|nr:hypothetical protein BC827DRAFT_887993 [Russula dissimulans]
MTNWHDPSLENAENIALVKLCHVLGGLYIWEFVWSIGYEYSIIFGKRKLTWTSPLYIATRWLTLTLVIIDFVAFNVRNGIDCQTVITLNFAFGLLSLLSASTLVILRAIALWEQKRVITAIAFTLWLTNASLYLYGMSTFHGESGEGFCRFNRGSHVNILMLGIFIIDFSTLALMVAGVLRWSHIRGRGGIWQLLYAQGLAWIVIFNLAALPPLIFVFLHLNDVMDRMFFFPEVIIMTICASRMYIWLANNAANPSPVRPIGDKERQFGTQLQFKKSPGPSSGDIS